jgi:uroporphyrinogen-III synthase
MQIAKQPTVFISRDLDEDSIFKQRLASKAKIIGRSLIQFKAISFEALPLCDWLFFYSKKGIHYCLSQLDNLEELPPIAVIGQASADFLWSKYNIQAQFVGTGHPEATAIAFSSLAKDKKVVFAQAQHSKQSVQQLLNDSVTICDLITYQNEVKVDFKLPLVDILVFTSPLNVKAYFDQYAYRSTQEIISIGRVTAKALNAIGITTITIAAAPNELELAIACLQFIQ